MQVLRDVLLSSDESSTGAAATRPHDQLFQMLSLALELLPPLPKPESERRMSGSAPVGTIASGASNRALEVSPHRTRRDASVGRSTPHGHEER